MATATRRRRPWFSLASAAAEHRHVERAVFVHGLLSVARAQAGSTVTRTDRSQIDQWCIGCLTADTGVATSPVMFSAHLQYRAHYLWQRSPIGRAKKHWVGGGRRAIWID